VALSQPLVEAAVIDTPGRGTLLTLVNWTNEPIAELEVAIRLPAAPEQARSVQHQTELPVAYRDGRAVFTVDLEWADYILLPARQR
jgi:hypothetical protein